MDGGSGFAEHYVDFNGDEEEEEELEEQQQQQQLSSDRRGIIEPFNHVDDSAGNDDLSYDDHRYRDSSSSGKLFVGGIAWETSEATFTNYFSKYGEITDSVIMMDKLSGRSRGFGFVTFADPGVADRVLEEDHVIDGRAVEVKRTVPREEMQVKGVQKTRKIFVGGIPPSLTEDELKEYFSSYGSVAEHQIMFDRNTGRSRGFGFVTFENEDAVERIFSDGRTHELGGKQVEIKRAVPKRAGGDYANDVRPRYGGNSSKSYGGFSGGAAEYGGGGYTGKMGRGYGAYGGQGGYGGGNYGGGAAGFYGAYGGYGYGYGFWGPMYGGGGYGGSGYGAPGGGYGGGGGAGSGTGYGGGKGYGGGGGSKGYGNGGAPTGRYHPYRK